MAGTSPPPHRRVVSKIVELVDTVGQHFLVEDIDHFGDVDRTEGLYRVDLFGWQCRHEADITVAQYADRQCNEDGASADSYHVAVVQKEYLYPLIRPVNFLHNCLGTDCNVPRQNLGQLVVAVRDAEVVFAV